MHVLASDFFKQEKNYMKLVHKGHMNRTARWNPLAGMGVLMVLAAIAVPARAQLAITTCNPAMAAPAGSLISTPGNYQVTADLTSVLGDCIVITASNVSLKLNGHIITGPGPASVGINVNPPSGRVDHVGISGPGLIQGFTNGVAMNNTDYSQVSQVTASHNSANGINGAGSAFLAVSSNVLTGNGIWGLLLTNLTNSTISFNEMTGNGISPTAPAAGGMRITGSADTVNNNIAIGNGSTTVPAAFNAGIVIGSTNTRVTSNITDGNVRIGILVLADATSNQIFRNTSSVGNSAADLEDDNTACDSNLWSDNSSFFRNQACVK
jgi:hypothetical protein